MFRACHFVDRPLAPALALLLLLIATSPALAGQTTYEYDNLNRLTRVSFADGSHTQYGYDFDGNRTSRVTVARPTLLVQRTPNPMVANEPYTVRWFATGASSISYACSAAGTGFNGSDTMYPPTWLPNGSVSSQGALPAWVGFDSNCLWTANGPGGALPMAETLRTVAGAPGRPMLTVVRVPNPMVAGRPYYVDWIVSGAAALTYACAATPPGYNGSGGLTPQNGRASAPAAEFGWVGFPSACRWTATAANGAVTIYDEFLVTIPDLDSQANAPKR